MESEEQVVVAKDVLEHDTKLLPNLGQFDEAIEKLSKCDMEKGMESLNVKDRPPTDSIHHDDIHNVFMSIGESKVTVYDPGINKEGHDETEITLGEWLQLRFFDPGKAKIMTQIKKGIADSLKFTEYGANNLEWMGYCLFLVIVPNARLIFSDHVTAVEDFYSCLEESKYKPLNQYSQLDPGRTFNCLNSTGTMGRVEETLKTTTVIQDGSRLDLNLAAGQPQD